MILLHAFSAPGLRPAVKLFAKSLRIRLGHVVCAGLKRPLLSNENVGCARAVRQCQPSHHVSASGAKMSPRTSRRATAAAVPRAGAYGNPSQSIRLGGTRPN